MFPSPFNDDKKSSSDHLQNPNLFNFPSPFLDEHESPLNQIFFQTLDHHTTSHHIHNVMTATTNGITPEKKDATTKRASSKEGGVRRRGLGVVPRRRTGKKDRHSKICTAQGVRDRRMRLSLQVARKFFDLQDMLGYDKASKTIEWLFTKSKKAIKDLINDHSQLVPNNSTTDVKSESFVSECEVVSGSVEENSNKDTVLIPLYFDPEVSTKSITKESREKARARARTRTRDKMMMENKNLNPNYDHDQHINQKLGFSTNSSPFEGVLVSPPYESDLSSFQHYQLADVGTIEKFLGNSSSYGNSDFMGFFGNWDLLNGATERSSSIFSVTNHHVSLAGNSNDEFMHK